MLKLCLHHKVVLHTTQSTFLHKASRMARTISLLSTRNTPLTHCCSSA